MQIFVSTMNSLINNAIFKKVKYGKVFLSKSSHTSAQPLHGNVTHNECFYYNKLSN